VAVSLSIFVGPMGARYRWKDNTEWSVVLKFEVILTIVDEDLGYEKKWGETEKLGLFLGWGEVEKAGGVGGKK
jgi:hypothetical protein